MKTSIIVPVFNEEKTVAEILEKLSQLKIEKEIIIINDGSTDKSLEKIKQFIKNKKNFKVFSFSKNKGKGAAVRKGISLSTGSIIIIQDADLEYDPQEIVKLITLIKNKKAKVVYGSRFTGERRNMFFWHMIGNRFLSLITNILYDTTLSDMEVGYKAIKRDVLEKINLSASRFDFEPEITAKILKRGIRIYEVPISYCGRERHEGKKITWKDGVVAIWTLFKNRLF